MMDHGKLVFAGTVDEFDNYIVPNTIFVHLANAPSTDVLARIEGVCGIEELGGQQFRVRFTDAQEVIERIVVKVSKIIGDYWRFDRKRIPWIRYSLN